MSTSFSLRETLIVLISTLILCVVAFIFISKTVKADYFKYEDDDCYVVYGDPYKIEELNHACVILVKDKGLYDRIKQRAKERNFKLKGSKLLSPEILIPEARRVR